MMRGALVYKSDTCGDQVIAPGIAGIAPITFDTVYYDTDGFWNAATGRFVIPACVSWVRLQAQAVFLWPVVPYVASNDHIRQLVIKKNFVTLSDWYSNRPGWAVGQVPGHTGTTNDVQASGPVLPVVEGDNFLVDAYHSSGGGNVSIRATNGTWFAIEVIE